MQASFLVHKLVNLLQGHFEITGWEDGGGGVESDGGR